MMFYKTRYYGAMLLSLSLIPLLFLSARASTINDSCSADGFSIMFRDKPSGYIGGPKNETITVEKINRTLVNSRISDSNLEIVGESAYVVYAVNKNGKAITAGHVKGSFTVKISYPNSLKPEIEKRLKILLISGNRWKLIPSKVDVSRRCVIADKVSELGIFCLVAPADLALKDVIVYPNPVQFGTFGGVSKELKFLNVPLGSVIEIFNISGEKIYTIREVTSTQVSWNGERDNGDLVTSGLYIYRIKTAGGEKYGKIAVVR